MNLVQVGASAEAFGHPSECSEPAIGEVQSISPNNITFFPEEGATGELASVSTADIHFDSHAHEYTAPPDGSGCTSFSSHDIDPDDAVLPQITVNGSKVYTDNNPVFTDPESGGDINITESIPNITVNYGT